MNRAPIGYDSVEFPPDCSWIKIIDQTQLPTKEVFLYIYTVEELIDSIKKLKVRGAPAIGVITAAGIAMAFRSFTGKSYSQALEFLIQNIELIVNARPTAVNAKWASYRMLNLFLNHFSNIKFNLNLSTVLLAKEASIIKSEDITMSISIAENALPLLKKGFRLMTYCNAGHLATARFGTALSPIYLGNEKGYAFDIFVPETRPLLQGSRLTAFELSKSGANVTLVCDNMSSSLMKLGKIDAILVGCDRIAKNGDVANKIGTSALAIQAKHYNIPFYVLGPESTIDPNALSGNDIIIEERDGEEITDMWYKNKMAPNNIDIFNPAFDITDSELITAIITNKKIYKFPYDFSIEDN